MNYTLTIYFKGLFGGKKEYDAVAHYCASDIPNFFVIVKPDRSVTLIALDRIAQIIVPTEVAIIKDLQKGGGNK